MLMRMTRFPHSQGSVVFHCMYIPCFLSSLTYQWTLELLQCLCCHHHAAITEGQHAPWEPDFISFVMLISRIGWSISQWIFLKSIYAILLLDIPIYNSLICAQWSPFLLNTCFNHNSDPNRYEMTSHCALHLHSSDNWYLFSYTHWSLLYLLERNIYSSTLPIFKLDYLGIWHQVVRVCFFCILDTNPLSNIWCARILFTL